MKANASARRKLLRVSALLSTLIALGVSCTPAARESAQPPLSSVPNSDSAEGEGNPGKVLPLYSAAESRQEDWGALVSRAHALWLGAETFAIALERIEVPKITECRTLLLPKDYLALRVSEIIDYSNYGSTNPLAITSDIRLLMDSGGVEDLMFTVRNDEFFESKIDSIRFEVVETRKSFAGPYVTSGSVVFDGTYFLHPKAEGTSYKSWVRGDREVPAPCRRSLHYLFSKNLPILHVWCKTKLQEADSVGDNSSPVHFTAEYSARTSHWMRRLQACFGDEWLFKMISRLQPWDRRSALSLTFFLTNSAKELYFHNSIATEGFSAPAYLRYWPNPREQRVTNGWMDNTAVFSACVNKWRDLLQVEKAETQELLLQFIQDSTTKLVPPGGYTRLLERDMQWGPANWIESWATRNRDASTNAVGVHRLYPTTIPERLEDAIRQTAKEINE